LKKDVCIQGIKHKIGLFVKHILAHPTVDLQNVECAGPSRIFPHKFGF